MNKTKKRVLYVFAALLAVVFVLACLAGFAACGGGDKCADGHTVTEWTTTKEATCTEAGSRTGVCDVCGEEVTETVAALGHSWGNDVVTDPTCKEGGYTTQTCSRCGATQQINQTNKTSDHTWGEGVVTTVATCTTAGTMTYTCSVCGETKTETIPATGHTSDGGKVTKEATIYETGEKTYTCTVCGEVISTETIPKLTADDYTSNFLTGDLSQVDESYVTYNNAVFADSEISVAFDSTSNPMSYTVDGYAAIMTSDQLTAFWGNGADDHENAQYITISIVVAEGETLTVKSEISGKTYTLDESDPFFTLVYDVSAWSDTNKGETVFTITDDKGSYPVIIGDIELYTVVSAEEELKAAIAEGGEIALADDIEITSALEISKDTELDLEGHTLGTDKTWTSETRSSGNVSDVMISVGKGVNLTIEDSSDEGTGKIDYSYVNSETARAWNTNYAWNSAGNHGAAIMVDGDEDTTVTIESGEIASTSVGIRAKNGDIVINGGKVYSSGYYVIWEDSGIASVTINGGLVAGDWGGILVDGDSNYRGEGSFGTGAVSTLTVNGGVVYSGGSKQGAIRTENYTSTDSAIITINGGKIICADNQGAKSSTDENTVKNLAAIFIGNGTLVVKAGTIIGPTAVEVQGGKTTISGGTLKASYSGEQNVTPVASSDPFTYGYALSIYPRVMNARSDNPSFTSVTDVSVTGGAFEGNIFVVNKAYNSTSEDWTVSFDKDESMSANYVVVIDDILDLVKLAYDSNNEAIADETAEGIEVDHYIFRAKTECELNGHVLVGTYADGSWTYTCDECGEAIDLAFAKDYIASLTLEVDDETSLTAAATWNEIEDMALTIHVVTTDDNQGKITVTSNFGLRYGEKTIVLDADIDMGSSYTIIVLTNVVLDLNGHTISRTNDSSLTTGVIQVGQYHGENYIYEYGNLIVMDSSEDQSGKISGSYGVTVYGGDNTDGYVSSLTLVSGTIEGSKIAISTNGSTEWGAELVTIQGGTVKGTGETSFGIYLPGGELNVSGGSISGVTGIEIKAGTVTVTGGTISTTVEDGTTNVVKESGSTDTYGYAIGIIDGTSEGAYKALTSVSIGDDVELTGDIYVDASIENVVTVEENLDLMKVAYDASGDVIANETAEGVEADHYIYTSKTYCEIYGHTATAYEETLYAVYSDDNDAWHAFCEVCGEWFEIDGEHSDYSVYDFVLVAQDEASLNAAIAVARDRNGSEEEITQILVYGTINISDDSYVLIDCDNVEIYGLGTEQSKIIDSHYENYVDKEPVTDGVEITGSNVTIRDLTIDGSALDDNTSHGNYEHGLKILDSASNVTLSNCVIIGGTSDTSSAVVLMGGQETGYLLIENCTLSGYHGIEIEHDGEKLEVNISGGKIDGAYGILIDAGIGIYLNVVGAEIYGQNSTTTTTTSVTFDGCTFGYHSDGVLAYGLVNAYCDVTLKDCTFLANDTQAAGKKYAPYGNSENYVIQARTEGITITIIDCKFDNTNDDLESGTVSVTEDTVIYVMGIDAKVTSCLLRFSYDDDAWEYRYDATLHIVEHNHDWAYEIINSKTGVTTWICSVCYATKTEITGTHVVSATPSSAYVVTTVGADNFEAPTFAITMSQGDDDDDEATVYDSIGDYLAQSGISDTVTWTSSDTNVATVDANGNITIVGAGYTTITVEFEITGVTASYMLCVGEAITDTDSLIGSWHGTDKVTASVSFISLDLTVEVYATVTEEGFTLRVVESAMSVDETIWDSVAWFKADDEYYIVVEEADGSYELIDISYNSSDDQLSTSFEFTFSYTVSILGTFDVDVVVTDATLDRVTDDGAGTDNGGNTEEPGDDI